MPRQSGIYLLSALRKYKSKSALLDTPDALFEEGEERSAFNWLRDYVMQHNVFPTLPTFERETGLRFGLTAEPLSYYIDDARRKATFEMLFEPYGQMRKLMETKNPDGVIELMRATVAAASTLNSRREGMTTLAQSMNMLGADYEAAKASMGALRGIPTGWDYLDTETDGWQNGDVITMVGRPKRGKTMLLLKSALAAHDAGYSVLFLSMEMTTLQLARRMFGMRTRVNPTFIRRGQLSTHEERQFYRNLNIMSEDEAPFHWLAGNFKKTVPALRAAAYECEPDLILADASYLLQSSGTRYRSGGRREGIADVIEEIGGTAKDLDRPIYQSVQFNRTAEKPKKGEDEQDRANPVAHLNLAKIGETDTVGQVSSIVLGAEFGDAPNEKRERYVGILTGREGEDGWMKINYRFQPVDLSEITNARRRGSTEPEEAPDLSFMDEAA